MYLSHRHTPKKVLTLQPRCPPNQLINNPRMALMKHATHEFSRLLPLPYPCFYSAFAFPNSSAFYYSLYS